MPLDPTQITAYAYQYVGLLMLHPGARADLTQCGEHDADGFHGRVATLLNKHLNPPHPLDENDATEICKYTGHHLREFRAVMDSIAPGEEESWLPYCDGMHAQEL